MHHTRAIVLRKDGWREHDLLVTLLSSDFGKIRALAQGARKHGAKLQGHLESGSVIAASIVSGKNGWRLTTARTEQWFPGIRASWDRTAVLFSIARTLDQSLFEEREGAAELFSAALEAISCLEYAARPAAAQTVAVWFRARLWKHLGLLPHPESAEAAGANLFFEVAARPARMIFETEPDLAKLNRQAAQIARAIAAAPVIGPPNGI